MPSQIIITQESRQTSPLSSKITFRYPLKLFLFLSNVNAGQSHPTSGPCFLAAHPNLPLQPLTSPSSDLAPVPPLLYPSLHPHCASCTLSDSRSLPSLLPLIFRIFGVNFAFGWHFAWVIASYLLASTPPPRIRARAYPHLHRRSGRGKPGFVSLFRRDLQALFIVSSRTMDRLLPFAACAALLANLANAQTATLSPVAAAASASPISRALNPSYAGFGIEPSNLFSFTGGSGGANALSVNLLQNLAGYSGAPPHLRIGGNTADNLIYSSSYTDYGLLTNKNPTAQGNVPADKWTIGPNYFAAIDRFPTNTPVTFGLNLPYAQSDYINVICTMAKAAINNLKNVQLYSFEIGNEPDLYLQNGFRNGTWDGSVYTQQWLDRAAAIYTNVLKAANVPSNFFEGPTTASTIGNTFEIPQLYNDGITAGSNGASTYVAGWNQHDYFYFVGVTGFPLTLDYMSQLSNTEAQFAYWAKQIGIALNEGIPYYLREMASAGPVGLQGISNTLGGALWTLNFFCYAATLGVMSVQVLFSSRLFPRILLTIDIDAHDRQFLGSSLATHSAARCRPQRPPIILRPRRHGSTDWIRQWHHTNLDAFDL